MRRGRALSLRGLPGRAQDRGPGSFDTRGAVLVTVIGGSVVALGSVQSLARNPWGTAVVLAVVAVCALLFVRAERRAAEPLIPPALFRDRAVSRSIASTALTGVALFGTFAFIPLAIQEGTGAGSDETGLLLLALTTGQPAATTTFSVIAQGRARPDLIGSTMGALTFARQLGRRDLPGRRPGRRAPRQGRRGRARGPGRRDHPPPGTGITADRRPVTALDLRVPAQDGTG
ncbi:hypothetical protein [Nonomuraea sp. WAC 01424]|uniref:hypothetical protein n=1 Tax=Nonomuraea sp. WAC 01424 TaxID=2203200 RepID=UPI0021ADD64E|nr:hypothetical protein [Nonomuraea sp. WAC 01424]